MAAEPKRRHSKARKRVRRASINLELNLVNCKNCGKLTKSHTVCKECGYYGRRPGVLGTKEITSKKTVKVTKA